MARRALLSETWWSQATAIPDDEREIAKHYTLDQLDLDLIMRQNKASNRLGLACVLAMLRFPGRPLADGEILPSGVLRFLARQIGADHREIDRYFERPQTRREHLALLFEWWRSRPYGSALMGRSSRSRRAAHCYRDRLRDHGVSGLCDAESYFADVHPDTGRDHGARSTVRFPVSDR